MRSHGDHARRIITELFTHTDRRGITLDDLAHAIDISYDAITRWRTGRLPKYATTATWALHLGLRLAAVDPSGNVLAEGTDLPARLRELRKRAGLSPSEAAARLHVCPHGVHAREKQRNPLLATAADHVTALGYRLVLLERGRRR